VEEAAREVSSLIKLFVNHEGPRGYHRLYYGLNNTPQR
jgi:hypothetical protein